MKKTTILLLCFLTTILNAQQDSFPQDTDKKNEITLTPLVLIVSGWADISYEYLINNKSSFGVDVQFNDNKKIFDSDGDSVPNRDYRNFSITPNYRVYFSNKYARGFFVEGFGMLHRYKDYYYDYNSDSYNYETKNITEFSLGISVGGKWVTKSGFVTEIFGGIGRNILNSNDDDGFDPINMAGRIGVSIGKRF